MSTKKSRTFNGLIGAMVTVLFSFTFISPLIGGAVAGYREKQHGALTGAISGGFALLMLIPLGSFIWILSEKGSIGVSFAQTLLLYALVVGIIWTIALSIIGGVIGSSLGAED